MDHQLSNRSWQFGSVTRGKQRLPPEATTTEFVAQLKRAKHAIECRELGPDAARARFGPFVDTGQERFVIFTDTERLLARRPVDHELHELVRTVRERGPAVDVFLVSPLDADGVPERPSTGIDRSF